ncbi:MAG: MBL fold metallo-hydrolase [Pseudomonadota bacterium]
MPVPTASKVQLVPSSSPDLTFLHDDVPDFGALSEIVPGLFWLRMPLPLALDHVNLWVLDDGPGWCIVDTGLNADALKAIWKDLLGGPLAGKPVTQLIITHYHPDHAGLAGWLWSYCQPRPTLRMAKMEYLQSRALQLDDTHASLDVSHAFYAATGLSEEHLARYRERGNIYRGGVHEMPAPFEDLQEGDTLAIGGRQWEVLKGSGHSPDMAMLHCAADGVFLCGDQILPTISPNVSIWPPEPFGDPLADFKTTLAALKSLPQDSLVLPGHGMPFRGLHARIDTLLDHHEERLDLAREACHDGVLATTVMDRLFERQLDEFQRLFAVGETLAHLNHLVSRDEITRREAADGRWIYSTRTNNA